MPVLSFPVYKLTMPSADKERPTIMRILRLLKTVGLKIVEGRSMTGAATRTAKTAW
jgi:hypothetical protein